MFNKLILIVIIAALSLGVWFLLEKIHPVFSAADILAESRQAGGMSAEMNEKYQAEMFKSDCVSFGIWGAVLAGFCGLFANVGAKRRVLGLIVGIVGGALLGGLAAYLGAAHYAKVEYVPSSSATYWIVRWALLVVPLGLAAGLAAGLSGGNGKQLVDGIVAGLVGSAISVIAITLLVGIVTPVERSEYVYPAFSQTRLLAIAVLNVAVLGLLILQLGKAPQANAVNTESPAAE